LVTDPARLPAAAVSANQGASGLTHAVCAASESAGPAVTTPALVLAAPAPTRPQSASGAVAARRTTDAASAHRLILAQRIDTGTR
jgi:hypothetical protein